MMRDRRADRGSTLIIVLIICALLAGIGIPLLTLTNMGPKISGGMRFHEQAFNAAEAGAESARLFIEQKLDLGQWISFSGHCVTQPAGIDRPLDALGVPSAMYFRRLSDAELLHWLDQDGDGVPDVANVIGLHQAFVMEAGGAPDLRFVYTAFLIDDEAGAAVPDPKDAILVVIGCVRAGTKIVDSVRLEIELALENEGSS